MKSSDINRGCKQYQDLYNINDADEYLYCIAYELAIRSAKDYLIETFKVFDIENNQLVLVKDEIEKQIFSTVIDKQLMEEVERIHSNSSTLEKIFLYWINVIEDELHCVYGVDFKDLYIDYTFFSNEFKAIYHKINNNSTLLNEKTIYNNIYSVAYNHSEYSRVTQKYPSNLKDDDFAEFKTIYKARYKRPFVFSTITANNQSPLIEIDINLPEKALLSQVTKLIKNIKEDNKHIITNNQMLQIADDNELSDFDIVSIKQENFIDKLIIYDYIELRKKEIIILNKEKKIKKNEEINYIKNSFNSSKDKKILVANIKSSYKKITQEDIKREISNKLNLSYETTNKYYKDIQNYINNQKYFSIINGKIIG